MFKCEFSDEAAYGLAMIVTDMLIKNSNRPLMVSEYIEDIAVFALTVEKQLNDKISNKNKTYIKREIAKLLKGDKTEIRPDGTVISTWYPNNRR